MKGQEEAKRKPSKFQLKFGVILVETVCVFLLQSRLGIMRSTREFPDEMLYTVVVKVYTKITCAHNLVSLSKIR